MADDLNNRGRRDRVRVNVHEKHELRYWRERFGCSAGELRDAVDAVGVMAKDVEQHLNAKRRPSASSNPAGADD